MDIISVLENSGIFNGVDQETIAMLAQKCEVKVYENGETVFQEGDIDPRGVFIIAGGEVIVTTELVEKTDQPEGGTGRSDYFITSLHPGDILGEISIIDSGPRSATAKAHGLTTVCFVPETSFMHMVESDYKAGYLVTRHIATLICQRLREADFAFKYKSLLG